MEGTRLGPYVIEHELGSGGMGRVYAARVDGRAAGLEAGARVALKVVHAHLLETDGFFKRFLREAEVGRAIQHENVVRTLDCDATAGAHFLVMEYVEGQTLRALLDELAPVPEALCLHIAREICRGLGAIHCAGVIHRDIKPENVLITPDHVVKVMDLGVARLADEAVRLSQTGAFVGSIHYAAPEALGGAQAVVDARADLHALGLVLYELATGTNPYVAQDVQQTIARVVNTTPRRLGQVDPQLSPFFEEVVHCLLAKHPNERFASAEKLLGVLDDGEDSEWWQQRVIALRAATERPLRRIRIPRETAVYGREPELERLLKLFGSAADGRGRVVLIEGEAGVGKSRLIDELVARLEAGGEDVNVLYGSYPPGGAATAAGAWATAYREQFGEAGAAAYLARTPTLVPAFDAVLRGDAAPEDGQELTRDSLQTCFVEATHALARERCTIVLIDDLHFAPDEGRALFSSLAMAAPDARVLLVGTTRPGVPEAWISGLTRLEHTSYLELQRLGAKDLVELLRDSLHSDGLANELAAQIALKSDGNPFFVFEILRGLRDGQFITQSADGSWVGSGVIDEIAIPSSVLDLVNARVADLGEAERDLLDVASCWGYEFDPVLVGEVCELGRIAVLKRFGHIERSHRLVRSAGRSYVFDHHQVQEALYRALNEQLRDEYHLALAEALEQRTGAREGDIGEVDGALSVELCAHFLRSSRPAAAIRYLDAARDHLRSAHLHADVAALLTRALETPELLAGVERARVLSAVGDALGRRGERPRQEAVLREGIDLADRAGARDLSVSMRQRLGGALLVTGRLGEAEGIVREALELLDDTLRPRFEGMLTGNLGSILWHGDRVDEGRSLIERAAEICAADGDVASELTCRLNVMAMLRMARRLDEAHEHGRRCLELVAADDDRLAEVRVLPHLASLAMAEGRLDEAESMFRRALDAVREVGNRTNEAIVLGDLSNVLLSMGRTAEARDTLVATLSLARACGAARIERVALHNLGQACFHLGPEHDDEALRYLDEALGESGSQGGVEFSAAKLMRARVLLRRGAVEEARAALAQARENAITHDEQWVLVHSRTLLAGLPGGDVEDGRRALSEHGHALDSGWLCTANLAMWHASGDRAYLEEARRLVDVVTRNVSPETRQSMLARHPVYRGVMDAWRAVNGENGGGAPGSESPTTAG